MSHTPDHQNPDRAPRGRDSSSRTSHGRQSSRSPRSCPPATVWLPAPGAEPEAEALPEDGWVLPDWALDKIRTELVPRPGGGPLPLLRVRVDQDALTAQTTGSPTGFDAGSRTTAYTSPGDGPFGIPLLLAEIHPDTVVDFSPSPAAPLLDPLPAPQADWPGFFHRAHRILPPEGILLVATRQHRDGHGLYDPLGELTACARSAGFLYLQHIIVTHTHPDANRLAPPHAPGADGLPAGLAHSDLLLFSPLA